MTESLHQAGFLKSAFYMDGAKGINPRDVTNDLWSVPAQVGTDSPKFIPYTLLLSQLALSKGKMRSGLPEPAWVNHALARQGVSSQLLLSAAPKKICWSFLGGKNNLKNQ